VAGLGEPSGELGRLAGGEHRFGRQAGRQAGRHEIVAFDEEGAFALTVLADVQ
jgi:hypothetical protein